MRYATRCEDGLGDSVFDVSIRFSSVGRRSGVDESAEDEANCSMNAFDDSVALWV